MNRSEPSQLHVNKNKFSYDYIYDKKLLKLNHSHKEKLDNLYDKYSNQKEENKNISIYRLLLRYHTLFGHGMQCALPQQVFTTLKKYLNTSFEGFASPLNCRYAPFCSAFHDTDKDFGSFGSFFDVFRDEICFKRYFPYGGSFEFNPPFIETIMEKMVY